MARDVRIGRRAELIAVAVALALLTVAAPRAAAQPDPTYAALTARYAGGDRAGAMRALAAWPIGEARARSAERARVLVPQLQRAAVMLHTDLAYALLQAGNPGSASAHLIIARGVISVMKGEHPDERARTFERRWYAFVASMYTAHNRLDTAEVYVRDGISLYARDARLMVARGAIREMLVTNAATEARTEASRASRMIQAASADFLRAISYDPALAIAHLHLGWVRLLANDDRCAADFETALARADEDTTRYLARLFLGRFTERHDRLEAARAHYEQALQLGPSYQTAYVALSRLEEALGHSARARELAERYTALPEKLEDPWWNYHLGGFDQGSLDWLRHEAQTP